MTEHNAGLPVTDLIYIGRSHYQEVLAERDKLRAEAERLRAALGQIVEKGRVTRYDWSVILNTQASIAQKALDNQ